MRVFCDASDLTMRLKQVGGLGQNVLIDANDEIRIASSAEFVAGETQVVGDIQEKGVVAVKASDLIRLVGSASGIVRLAVDGARLSVSAQSVSGSLATGDPLIVRRLDLKGGLADTGLTLGDLRDVMKAADNGQDAYAGVTLRGGYVNAMCIGFVVAQKCLPSAIPTAIPYSAVSKLNSLDKTARLYVSELEWELRGGGAVYAGVTSYVKQADWLHLFSNATPSIEVDQERLLAALEASAVDGATAVAIVVKSEQLTITAVQAQGDGTTANIDVLAQSGPDRFQVFDRLLLSKALHFLGPCRLAIRDGNEFIQMTGQGVRRVAFLAHRRHNLTHLPKPSVDSCKARECV